MIHLSMNWHSPLWVKIFFVQYCVGIFQHIFLSLSFISLLLFLTWIPSDNKRSHLSLLCILHCIEMEEYEDVYNTPIALAMLNTKECSKLLDKVSSVDGSLICCPLTSAFEEPTRISLNTIGIVLFFYLIVFSGLCYVSFSTFH